MVRCLGARRFSRTISQWVTRGAKRLAGEDVVDANGLVGGGNVAVLRRRAEEAIAVGVARLLHLRDDTWPLFAAAQVAALGMVRQVDQLLFTTLEVPEADGIEVAHDHMGTVAITHSPGADGAQLDQPRILVAVAEVGLVDGEVAPAGQPNARFQQAARLLAFDVGQVVGSAGDDRPAAQQRVAVGAGRHVVLGRPAHAGAEDKGHLQTLCQCFQCGQVAARHLSRVKDLVQSDDVRLGSHDDIRHCI